MTSGSARSVPPGHVCWSYDDPAVFDARAQRFLLAGLDAGERVRYVTAEPEDVAVARWRDVPRLRAALGSGAAEVVSVRDTYGERHVVDPADQVATYATLTDAALADGHAGLRVAADATALVVTAEQRDAFARYEHLVDRFMRARPMVAACGYDRRALGDAAIEELACLHPSADPGTTLFHLYAGADDLVLTGELDTSNHDVFDAALTRAHLDGAPGDLVIRADGLRFVDHRNLTHLNRYAARRGGTVTLHTPLTSAARLVELLGLHRIRVEVAR
ncbi:MULTISPECIES: MEDS domain-containing protein [unclassified Micromonospora]|uniref:MEDS domain-containing protein n=1 Tax=unclassified Micromonospora TaxID=2617518 RepID=UPI002FF3D478